MCDCEDARKWRAYWTREAIAERTAADIERGRRVVQDALFWGTSFWDADPPPRVPHRMTNLELPDDWEAVERRRGGYPRDQNAGAV